MDELKFPNKSYKPKQLLHWCFENEDFDRVIIIGTKVGGITTYHTSSEEFGFLSLVYFIMMNLVTRQMLVNEFKKKP